MKNSTVFVLLHNKVISGHLTWSGGLDHGPLKPAAPSAGKPAFQKAGTLSGSRPPVKAGWAPARTVGRRDRRRKLATTKSINVPNMQVSPWFWLDSHYIISSALLQPYRMSDV